MFVQRRLDDLGTPLSEVTFCVLDLETTGTSPEVDGITEVGAVNVRGGECLGTFQTLVDPQTSVPAAVSLLTGLTDRMLAGAPSIDGVLPAFLEFAGNAVLVGHNVRFDMAFLRAALERRARAGFTNAVVDTCALARRLLADEVPNCRLGTLAERLRLDHRPTHRALDDALATVDLLHVLLERAAGLGVLGLDDLLVLPKLAGHPQAPKLKLTAGLPRKPGVYVFRSAAGRPLYVGTATDLRARVRSYFSSDTRRKIPGLLREAHSIDHQVCTSPLEAAILEVRMIHDLSPPYNRQGKRWRSYAYVKLTAREPFPRLAVVRAPKHDGGLYLGPVASTAAARQIVEAIEQTVPLRRCTAALRGTTPIRDAPCAPAQLGVATCPCAGTVDVATYAGHVQRVRRGLAGEPALLLEPLQARIDALAGAERFEEASDTRDRAAALTAALRRQRQLDGLRRSGRLVIEWSGRTGPNGVELHDGRLVGPSGARQLALDGDEATDADAPMPRRLADELACVARWLTANAARVRLVHCDGGLSEPIPALPTFRPTESAMTARTN
jgi:DNA polymerase-3 subunit epsilon